MARETNAFVDEPTGTIQHGRGGFLRNAQDTPFVTDPTGATVKSGPRKGEPKRLAYGSPSSRGKQIENTYNLQKWSERRGLFGLGRNPALWAQLLDLARLDPEGDEYKELADTIWMAARTAADASLAADRGTHTHALSEDHDEERDWIVRAEAGEDLGLGADVQSALVGAWREMLERDGLEILAVEASCVDDTWRLAGTLDRIARTTKPLRFAKVDGEIVEIPAGTVLVLDVKTGKRRVDRNGVVQFWQAYAVQVASYAQSRPYDVKAETRGDWGWPIDQDHALIAHLDVLAALAGEPSCQLVYCDIKAGREHGGQTVVEAKAWEKRNDVFSIAQLDAVGMQGRAAGADGSNESGGSIPASDPAAHDHGAEVPPNPATSAPPPVAGADPPPSPAAPIDEAAVPSEPQAAASSILEAAVERMAVDAANEHPQPDLAPTPPPFDPHTPGEGADMGGDEYDTTWTHLQTLFQALPRPALNWTGQLIKEAREANVGFQVIGGKTARRFELYRGMIALATAGQFEDDAVRALVALAMESDAPLFPGVTVGHALGALDVDGAARFAAFVDKYLAPTPVLAAAINEAGQFTLVSIPDLAVTAA